MKRKFKKFVTLFIILCMLNSTTIIVFANDTDGTTVSNRKISVIKYKQLFAKNYSEIILNKDAIYSWNYADETETNSTPSLT